VISFELSSEQSIARDMTGEFARNVLRPLARDADEAGAIERGTLNQLWDLGLVQRLAAGDEDAASGSAIMSALMLEELGWGDAAFALALAAPLGFVRAIVEQGSAAQKEELLPLFNAEEYRGAAVALAESGLGSGLAALKTTAETHADGFRINGAKIQVPLVGDCSHLLVIASYEGKPDAFIVDLKTPGVIIEEPEGNLGLKPLRLATVRFKDAVIGPGSRLGGNQGCDVRRIADAARVGAASILVGISKAVYDFTVPYTKDRVVHGAALAKKQSVAFRLVDVFTEVEASRWMCWRAATHLDKRHDDATRSAALAHVYTVEQAEWITDEGVQLLGGHGFMRANPVELWYRNARTLALLEGMAGV
jgi:alkylation response protein AidB-like acyl-CoA dehydrogenase